MQRFFKNVIKSEGGCWEWTGSLRGGYGAFKINGKVASTDRLSYLIFKGPIDNGLLVCHKCDNRKCINPDHLFLGTHKDNYQDAYRKGKVRPPDNKDKIKHPSQSAYKKGCRCDDCKEVNKLVRREYRKKIKNV